MSALTKMKSARMQRQVFHKFPMPGAHILSILLLNRAERKIGEYEVL
jgi:hypothetical protein